MSADQMITAGPSTTSTAIELSAGTIDYRDTGGNGPPIVLLHGLLMDATLWDDVVAELADDYRCIAPTLPLGAHRQPVRADADLSLPGIARLVSELLERLELDDVTLVGNDTGGGLVQILTADRAARVGRIALVSCDAFDNFPPGLTGRTLVLAGKLPAPLFGLLMQQMRLRSLRRTPIAFGWLTIKGDAITRRWIDPILSQPEIRRDTVRVLREVAADRDLMLRVAEGLAGAELPALVVWARHDRVMPPEHGHRLAELLSHGRLVEIDDSYSLIPLDQPTMLARFLRSFIGDADTTGASGDER
jgi:pimeloyl-ACP methyl ester carboxylesterase